MIQYRITDLHAFISLPHQAKGESRKIPCAIPFVQENINPATDQELESICYIRATEKVPEVKNVGKILFSEREEGGGPCTQVCRQN